MRRRGAPSGVALRRRKALAGALSLLTLAWLPGCVYYNAIYNAEEAFEEAEEARSLGDDAAAAAGFDEVVRRAAAGYRKEPDGPWADEALYLLGRAHLRRGDLVAAEAALQRARDAAGTPELRHGAEVHLAAIQLRRGRREDAFALLQEGMASLPPGRDLGEGHFLRAHLLVDGSPELLGTAWWDLERAAALAPTLALPAALARVQWALRLDAPARAGEGVRRIVAHPRGGTRRDSLEVLLDAGAAAWGVTTTLSFLDGSPDSPWSGDDRARLRLGLARLLHRYGQPAAARAEARAIAEGAGETAAHARIQLARWILADARDPSVVQRVRVLLLPVEGVPDAATLLEAVSRLQTRVDRSPAEPLALFSAAEEARDRLEAPILARGLFLAYANGVHGEPWIPKALMAALELSVDEGERSWIRDRLERNRLEGRPGSPYVLAARGRATPGLAELEAELARRLQELNTP